MRGRESRGGPWRFCFQSQDCTGNVPCAIEGARRGDPHGLGQGPPSRGGDQSRVLRRGQEEVRCAEVGSAEVRQAEVGQAEVRQAEVRQQRSGLQLELSRHL